MTWALVMLLTYYLLVSLSVGHYDINDPARNLAFRKYVDREISLLSLNYDPLVNLTISSLPEYCLDSLVETNKTRISILILGDSIDRYLVDEICLPPAQSHDWGIHFAYKEGASASAVCETETFTIGFLHIYGTKFYGPYLHNHANTEDDPYADTILRIIQGIRQFTVAYGVPDFILFRSDLWDLHITGFKDLTWQENNREQINATFIKDCTADFALIHTISPTSVLGTHTIPRPTWGLYLFHQYENGLRYVSQRENYFLFDWEKLLLPLSGDVTTYLRDVHHPNPTYTRSFGSIIISLMKKYFCIT